MTPTHKDFSQTQLDGAGGGSGCEPVWQLTPRLIWLREILDKIQSVMERKNQDYASDTDWMGNFRRYGLFGMMARLHDKVQRAENLLFKNETQGTSESIEDTLEDLAAYALLTRQAYLEKLSTYGSIK